MRKSVALATVVMLTLQVVDLQAKAASSRGSGNSRRSSSGSSHRSSSGSSHRSSSSSSSGSGSSSDSSSTKGYFKKSGKYVEGYTRTKADKSTSNNYSTKGNYNPRTSKTGTRSADKYK